MSQVTLDVAWASFEKKYISELIAIEDQARSKAFWHLGATVLVLSTGAEAHRAGGGERKAAW